MPVRPTGRDGAPSRPHPSRSTGRAASGPGPRLQPRNRRADQIPQRPPDMQTGPQRMLGVQHRTQPPKLPAGLGQRHDRTLDRVDAIRTPDRRRNRSGQTPDSAVNASDGPVAMSEHPHAQDHETPPDSPLHADGRGDRKTRKSCRSRGRTPCAPERSRAPATPPICTVPPSGTACGGSVLCVHDPAIAGPESQVQRKSPMGSLQ